jgi:four helix bundle protein
MIKNLDDFKAYQMAMTFGEAVWSIVNGWNYFQKDTVGKQFVRAADSIAANLSEGLGRYHFKEAKQFGYYSRGSLFESKTWLAKSLKRDLIDEKTFQGLNQDLDIIGKMINGYISSIGEVREPIESYPSLDS